MLIMVNVVDLKVIHLSSMFHELRSSLINVKGRKESPKISGNTNGKKMFIVQNIFHKLSSSWNDIFSLIAFTHPYQEMVEQKRKALRYILNQNAFSCLFLAKQHPHSLDKNLFVKDPSLYDILHQTKPS